MPDYMSLIEGRHLGCTRLVVFEFGPVVLA